MTSDWHPEQRYWQNRETADVGLDSSVGRAPARQSGGRRFKSRSSQFFFVHQNLSKTSERTTILHFGDINTTLSIKRALEHCQCIPHKTFVRNDKNAITQIYNHYCLYSGLRTCPAQCTDIFFVINPCDKRYLYPITNQFQKEQYTCNAEVNQGTKPLNCVWKTLANTGKIAVG